jgi:FKBP-type peptidyl-prolyl cis-trans isomerase
MTPHICSVRTLTIAMLLVTAACGGGSGGCGYSTGAGIESAGTNAPPDVAAPPADAAKTSSGLASKVLTPGTGTRHPRPDSRVRVHYTGWTTDGRMFDSSLTSGQPITFGLNEVIPGWTEGVQMMVEGEKRRFWIPAKLAYEGVPSKPQGLLVFDIELVRIES